MKKGFTLIELLAVIVILAIIALIATPIVLNIINETKESANLRSAEMYLDAVEQSIARSMLQNEYITDGTYNITKDGDICLENFDNTNRTCQDTNTLAVEVEGEKPSKGNVTIIKGTIDGASLELGNKTLGKSGDGGVVPVCILSSDSTKKGTELGAKYECEVRPGEKQIFYVISPGENGTTNLIMDSNINKSGVAIKSNDITDKGYVAWNESGNNIDGPISAMDYLSTATSNWTNLQKMTINEFDYDNKEIGYMEKIYKIYARLPYVGEINVYNPNTGEYLYLYNNLVVVCNDSNGFPTDCQNADEKSGIFETGMTHITGVWGYWTLTAFAEHSNLANIVHYDAYVGDGPNVDYNGDIGVRPVITIRL